MSKSYAERFAKTALMPSSVKKSVRAGHGTAAIAKADQELQVVYGEIYSPGFPDAQGDFMTAETIRKMAWQFLKDGNVHKIDVQHNQQESGAYVVESFIAREDDPIFIPGSWVLGVHIPDTTLWSLVKSGDLNGFSLDGFAVRVETEIEIVVPNVLVGKTDEVEGHTHEFYVEFDAETNTVSGQTDAAPDGHFHVIKGATKTESASGHQHRFSFVEGIMNVS